MKSIAVYTVLIGAFDTLKSVNPEFKKEADFYLITNQDIRTQDYIINKVVVHRDNRRASRKYKFNPHIYLPGYKYTIYLDGSIELLESPLMLVNKYLKHHNIAVLKHPWRDCIYDELVECRRLGLIGRKGSGKHETFLRMAGYPVNNGLTENGVMIRRKCVENARLSSLWYEIYNIYTQRDQLSFCFCTWRLNIKYQLIDGTVRRTKNYEPSEFLYHPHL